MNNLVELSSEFSGFAQRLLGLLSSGTSKDQRKKDRKKDATATEDEGGGPGRSLQVLEEFVENCASKGPDGLVKQYQKIDPICDSSAAFEAFKSNMVKNRYSDVYCRDSTRVRLTIDSSAGDYIHANFIDSPLLLNKFICTQGPLSTTIYDFWRMVFQERVESILMLCRPMEDGRPKCVPYWPEEYNNKLRFTALTVTHRGEDKDEFSTLTLLIELNKEFECPELDDQARMPLVVKLYRWTSWPDRGIPDEKSCMIPIRLLDKVRDAPCVVHCSAGIGRTGSLLALEIALQKISRGQTIDVEQITRELRRSRCQAIQTEAQYLYIHRVLVENALFHVSLDPKAIEAGKKFMSSHDERYG